MPVRRDVALVASAFALCPVAAALAPLDPAVPLARAQELVALERGLGLYFEADIYRWFVDRPVLLTIVSFLYLWGHVPATVGALVWARLEHPHAFPLARDTFLATQLVVIAGYLAFPTAPPRMLAAFGSDAASDGFVTLIQSPYAAMPSGHAAFAVVTSGIVCSLAPWRWVRGVVALYPLLVAVIVLGTANHFWIDAVAGAGAALAGLVLAVMARTSCRIAANRGSGVPRTEGEHVSPDAPPPGRRPRPATPT